MSRQAAAVSRATFAGPVLIMRHYRNGAAYRPPRMAALDVATTLGDGRRWALNIADAEGGHHLFSGRIEVPVTLLTPRPSGPKRERSRSCRSQNWFEVESRQLRAARCLERPPLSGPPLQDSARKSTCHSPGRRGVRGRTRPIQAFQDRRNPTQCFRPVMSPAGVGGSRPGQTAGREDQKRGEAPSWKCRKARGVFSQTPAEVGDRNSSNRQRERAGITVLGRRKIDPEPVGKDERCFRKMVHADTEHSFLRPLSWPRNGRGSKGKGI